MPTERASGWRARWINGVKVEVMRLPYSGRAMANDGSTSVAHSEGSPADGARAGLYAPRILQQHLATNPGDRWWAHAGTAVFSDVSGFTRLSEQLARKGREGSEQITEVIGQCFESILAVAYDNGASLLKFGGDALLLWFQDSGHAIRACRASVLMRRALRDVGRIDVPGAKTTLRMSQGIHSGHFHFFMVGETHHELVVAGPAWSRVVTMEHLAEAGQILVSTDTAALLPARCLGAAKGPGVLLLREPGGKDKVPLIPRPTVAHDTLARCLSPAVRAHVLGGGGAPEHRPVTVAFIRFEGVDTLIEREGAGATADLLHRLVAVVESATEAQKVALLASDIDVDGGKLILTAGAPIGTGEDEERMLLALRAIVDARLPIPVRIGVNRGAIFAGDIGPFYRRTYTVMGDVVNLAARLMAKAQPGRIYATADVLDRSNTLFDTAALEPFLVKGKAKPVEAWDVGKAVGSRTRHGTLLALPLTGRDAEIATLREALTAARSGSGHVFELVGEAGVGKSRLASALREEATDFHRLHAVCEAYTASTPYAVWQELLRELVGIGRGESDDTVALYVREIVTGLAPSLLPWLPLVAIAFGVEVPSTPEVDMLAENNRRPKLHEAIVEFLAANLPGATLIELENAHHMDVASSELLAYVAQAVAARPWVIVSSRRPAESGSGKPAAAIKRIDLEPLGPADTLKLVRYAAEQHPLPLHVVELVAKRSGGNPQFLRDLFRAAIDSGGVGGLPDSAEAATMARIDALIPDDKTLLRRAAVFGLTFHPRMLEWLDVDEEKRSPDNAVWQRLHEFFDKEGDGYLRFRRALVRDAAYEGLPFKLRRRLHLTVAQRLLEESKNPEESANILSLHYFEAGEYLPAWRHSRTAAARAEAVFANVEAAGFYQRALEAAKRLGNMPKDELAAAFESLGNALLKSTQFAKASDAFRAARRLNVDADPLIEARLLMRQARIEEMGGKYDMSRRWLMKARHELANGKEPERLRQMARIDGWYASVLQMQGRTREAVRWAKQTIVGAEAVGDDEALGIAYLVLGTGCGIEGTDGAEAYYRLSLEAFERAGNLARQPPLLTNIGLACQWNGRWDEALEYYERGRDGNVKIGSDINATIARTNIAEILVDRGQWADAEALLRDILPFWKASKYRYLLATTLLYLGRVYLRVGRLQDALARLAEAKSHFEQIGAADEVPPVDARIAECRVYEGAFDEALHIVSGMLQRAASSKAIARLLPLLKRIQALALLGKGDDPGARAAAEESLRQARALGMAFEVLLTLLVLDAIDERRGGDSPSAHATECAALVTKFKISDVPSLPQFAQE